MKEYWLDQNETKEDVINNFILKSKPSEMTIDLYDHVIEFAAYQQAQARIKQLEILIGDMNNNLEEFIKKADEVLKV